MSEEVDEIVGRVVSASTEGESQTDREVILRAVWGPVCAAVIEALKLAEAKCRAIANEKHDLSLEAAAAKEDYVWDNFKKLNGQTRAAFECVGAIKALYEDEAVSTVVDLMAALKSAIAPKGGK